jgi:phosphatidate cytidylyltransferase
MARLLSGLILAVTFFALVWFTNAYVLLIVALIVCVLAFQEYAMLMHQIGAEIPKIPTLVATLAALAVVPFPYVAGEAVVGIGLLIVAIAVMMRLQPGTHAPIHGASAAALSIIYLGLPLGALVGIHIFGGRGAVVLLIFTIVVSDSAQYYTGRTLGRHPLAPRLSPKKTIEGAVGGFVAAPIFLYFAGPYLVPAASPLIMAALGVPLAAAGIAGDLFESMLKRAADMKDSSALIPGHGGILDRIDALLFATPIFYMYLRYVYAT